MRRTISDLVCVYKSVIAQRHKLGSIPHAVIATVSLEDLAKSHTFRELDAREGNNLLRELAVKVNTLQVYNAFMALRPRSVPLNVWWKGMSADAGCWGTLLRDAKEVHPQLAVEMAAGADLSLRVVIAEGYNILYSEDAFEHFSRGVDVSSEDLLQYLGDCILRGGPFPSLRMLYALPSTGHFARMLIANGFSEGVYQRLLEDPSTLLKWNLLDIGLRLLSVAEVSPLSHNFPSIVDEYGSRRNVQGYHLNATVSVRSAFRTEHLLALAPLSAFWRSALRLGCVSFIKGPGREVGVQLTISQEPVASVQVPAIRVIFEDDAIIVLDKPAGVPTECQLFGAPQGDVLCWIAHHRPQIRAVSNCGIVQRLDKGTSGVMVVGKTEAAVSCLQRRTFLEKEYVAVCRDLRSNTVSRSVQESTQTFGRNAVTAVTRFRIARRLRQSLVVIRATLTNGKKHQIRRHLAATGLPLLGDSKYGGAVVITCGMNRVALHARSVTLVHPTTGADVTFRSPLAEDLREFLKKMAVN